MALHAQSVIALAFPPLRKREEFDVVVICVLLPVISCYFNNLPDHLPLVVSP